MISKEILIQYADLQQEISELQARKIKLEKQFKTFLDGGTVTDMVTGGSGGIQHFKIEGFPIVAYEKARNALSKNIQRIEDKYTELLELQNEVEEYIESIDDSRMRRIIRMRFLDKMTWNQVANNIGGNNTEDSIRMAFNRFFGRKLKLFDMFGENAVSL